MRFRELLQQPALKQEVSTNEAGSHWTNAQSGHCHFDVVSSGVKFRLQVTKTQAKNIKKEAIRVLRRLQAFCLEEEKVYKTAAGEGRVQGPEDDGAYLPGNLAPLLADRGAPQVAGHDGQGQEVLAEVRPDL